MPIYQGRDTKGDYYQWGNHGKRYYYKVNSERDRKNAHRKAIMQMVAAHYSGYREK